MLKKDDYSKDVKSYKELYKDEDSRKKNYGSMVSRYYDIVTDFYEYGYGESFHFAPRHSKETRSQSIARFEHLLALKLELKEGMKVLDIGCGVGGPLREISRFSGANIIGLNISEYQVKKRESL